MKKSAVNLKSGWVRGNDLSQPDSSATKGIFCATGFDWRAADAYLFDIDGTLLNSKDAVHYWALHNAVKEVYELELDVSGVPIHGNTDVGILRGFMQKSGIAEAEWLPKLAGLVELISEEVERKIGGITYQNNTRLGAAIRHAAARLATQEARTRLLIVLSDGRPYDHDYGDARYAREDTREALRQTKLQGITPFCITIDRESESELKDLYGDVGYTIIDDVMSLPERMPGIYRRLTT